MALVSCPDCAAEVSDLAPACLKCGRPIAGPKAADSTESPRGEPEIEPGLYGLLAAAVLIGIVMLWSAGWFSTPRKTDPEPVVRRLGDQRHDAPVSPTNIPREPTGAAAATGAWVACKGFVEERLKSPGSASFPWYSDGKAIHLGGEKYQVRSYVDSQNSFSARLRTDFDCTVTFVSGGWKLEGLKMSTR